MKSEPLLDWRIWFRQVFGLHRFKLHRHLIDGTVKSVWFRQFSLYSQYKYSLILYSLIMQYFLNRCTFNSAALHYLFFCFLFYQIHKYCRRGSTEYTRMQYFFLQCTAVEIWLDKTIDNSMYPYSMFSLFFQLHCWQNAGDQDSFFLLVWYIKDF